jgi:Mor family transcriptional regulator
MFYKGDQSVSEADQAEVKARLAAGKSVLALARAFKTSRQTIMRVRMT